MLMVNVELDLKLQHRWPCMPELTSPALPGFREPIRIHTARFVLFTFHMATATQPSASHIFALILILPPRFNHGISSFILQTYLSALFNVIAVYLFDRGETQYLDTNA